MDKYPEDFHDELESYPLRLNVAALPDRRFFKMTRTLTVGTVLLAALLIVLGVWLNYQLTHLDVTVRRNGVWQFYRVDPVDKRLEVVQSAEIKLDPLQLVVEERLREYLKLRHSTVWNEFELAERFKPKGLIAQMSSPEVLMAIGPESKAMIAQTRGAELVRDVHIYDLQVVSTRVNQTTGLPLYLWTALVEFFDLPLTDEGEAMCACTDNSKACLA